MPKVKKSILITISILICAIFVVKFGGPSLIRLYVEYGLGSCKKIPIFCLKPQEIPEKPAADEKYLSGLLCSKLNEIRICTPGNFQLIKHRITKVYYRHKDGTDNRDVIYLLYEPPNFFVDLFPQAKKENIKDDYAFITRIMYSSINEINNLQDAFFAIMKGIFTPDLGQQVNVKIVKLITEKQKGYISYNLGKTGNYFDCNIFDANDNFFKVYIKDKAKILDLNKVLMIISTVKKAPGF